MEQSLTGTVTGGWKLSLNPVMWGGTQRARQEAQRVELSAKVGRLRANKSDGRVVEPEHKA